jgi:hypothetical protein
MLQTQSNTGMHCSFLFFPCFSRPRLEDPAIYRPQALIHPTFSLHTTSPDDNRFDLRPCKCPRETSQLLDMTNPSCVFTSLIPSLHDRLQQDRGRAEQVRRCCRGGGGDCCWEGGRGGSRRRGGGNEVGLVSCRRYRVVVAERVYIGGGGMVVCFKDRCCCFFTRHRLRNQDPNQVIFGCSRGFTQ